MRKLYETIFIINPNIDDAGVGQAIESVKNLIESNGYEVKKVEPWGKRRLAYEVKKNKEGFFVLIVFESEPEFVEQLQQYYRIAEPIIKYIVVRFQGDFSQPSPMYEAVAETAVAAEEEEEVEIEAINEDEEEKTE